MDRDIDHLSSEDQHVASTFKITHFQKKKLDGGVSNSNANVYYSCVLVCKPGNKMRKKWASTEDGEGLKWKRPSNAYAWPEDREGDITGPT